MTRLTRLLPIALALLVIAPQSATGGTTEDAEVALEFALARSLSEEGAIAEAEEAWRRLLLLAPQEPYVRIEYGRFLSRMSRFDEAVEQVAGAREVAPDNRDVLRGYVDVLLAASRGDARHLAAAVEGLERLVELDPSDLEAAFDLGRTYHEQGRYAEAAVWLGRAAEAQPGNRTLGSYHVDALLQSGQEAPAEAALRDMLARDPAFLRARIQLATLERERGDHLGSAGTLRSAPAEQRGDRQLRWQLAGQLYRLAELDEGLTLIDSLLESDPEAFRERSLKAMMLASGGDYDAALEIYAELRQERPLNQDLVAAMVEIYERQGQPRRAEELLLELDRALAEAGRDQRRLQVRLELMSHLWRIEAWDRLAREARPLAEDTESPLRPQAVFFVADALHATGRSEQALELLARAADGDSMPAARLAAKRAEILADMGRTDEAEALLSRLSGAGDLPSLMAAAEVYHREERYPEAATVLEQALELDPTSSRTLFWLGAAHERAGDAALAAQTFGDLLELDPLHAPALNYLGYMWAERGERLDEALDLVRGAVAQEPDNGAYVDSLGWAHYQLGDYARAQILLERAARLIPDDAVISEHLGDVYSRLGDTRRARESYRRALELDGENRAEVQRKLDSLEVPR
jgi:tetratricopeptide (TPR) repeat protein